MRLDVPAHPHVRVALMAFSLTAAVFAGGCSNSRTAEAPQRQWVGAAPAREPRIVDAYTPEPGDPIKEAPVEPATRRVEPDDPSEPFSPNYGRNPAPQQGAPRHRVANASE
jgi:hypothetical protein